MSSVLPRQHNHSGGSMSMPLGVPSMFHMQKIFWAFVGAAIGAAAVANLLNKILYYQRISAVRNNPIAAKPRTLFFQAHATTSAIIREFSYYSIPVSFRKTHVYLPPLGPVILVIGYVVLIVVCCLYRLDPKNFLEWEDIGYRSGFMAVAQLPLIVLLSGKRNIIGFFTGVGYERLTWFHRWIARALLLTVLIHMGFFFTAWDRYDYVLTKIKQDRITQKGLAAGSVLLWLVVSSISPIRGLSYEIFVVQHIISWLGFLAAVYLHVPAENWIWIWLPLAFWAFDRVVRAAYLFYTNLSIFHKKSTGVLACNATFEPLDDSHTRITILNPPVTWQAGQHMFLTCHPLAPLSSHPFTIASLPEDGKMEFIVRARKGATKKFFKYAEKVYPTLPSTARGSGRSVLVEGPYARVRPLRQFDSLVFVAGSTGATFAVPLMRDVVREWDGISSSSNRKLSIMPPAGAVTRHIRFVWVVKRRSSASWFASHLNEVVRSVEALRNEGHDVAVEISIYVTCDDALTSGQTSVLRDDPEQSSREDARRSRSISSDEKGDITSDIELVTETKSSSEKECCCTRVITDEDAITGPCNCASTTQRHSSSISISQEKSQQRVEASIPILSGRPHIFNLIRKTAELALGEMAVVVCGPPGMVQCTRNAVVAISNDRAVHKGTGAQGIYVHAETFSYA